MQNQAAMAYQQVAKQTVSPRNLESSLLSKSAGRLQRIQDDWENSQSELFDALLFNRRIWQVFLSSVTRDDNPLPENICENVANLGVFVLKQTMSLMTAPDPRKLNALISINRELALGLRAAMNKS